MKVINFYTLTDKMEIHCNSIEIKENMVEKRINNLSGSLSDLSEQESVGKNSINTNLNRDHSDNDENEDPVTRTKKTLQRLSESNSEWEDGINKNTRDNNDSPDSVTEENNITLKKTKSKKRKSRIRAMSISDSDDDMKDKFDVNKKYDLSRIENKKKNLRKKFHNLISQRGEHSTMEINTDNVEYEINNCSKNSDESSDSCKTKNNKQKFEEKQIVTVSSICDPDTSDEENISIKKQKKKPMVKTMKLTSPKPMRISAKQAMENMQKIKSESNRMLREKDVSLPYHKPKALSLKDIMSRRKPALAPDGKALSVKMSLEQLQQYALMLEQRQKEMMELCKSDTDEEEITTTLAEAKNNDENSTIGDNIDEKDEKKEDIMITKDVPTSIPIYENIEKTKEISSNSENFEPVDCASNVFNCSANDVEVLDKEADSIDGNFKDQQEVKYITDEDKNEHKDITKDSVDASKVILSNEYDKEQDSQLIELQYDSEKTDSYNLNELNKNEISPTYNTNDLEEANLTKNCNFDEIDAVIENFEHEDIVCNNQQMVEINSLKNQPKLTGAPGMLIDLDNGSGSKKILSGVELLKERYRYFTKLKSLEDQEKDREKKYKPGMQHLKLKHELEEQIAEQRSLEWAKRLENEKQQQLELNAIHGEESDTDDIMDVKAKLNERNDSIVSNKESSESTEEDEEEEEVDEDCEVENKPKKRNPMIDYEAEESDIEEGEELQEFENNDEKETNCIEKGEDFDASDEDCSDDESSESDDEIKDKKPKKGRILKAFEDSDDEDNQKNISNDNKDHCIINSQGSLRYANENTDKDLNISGTQDEELQLAQVHKSSSENIIETQESVRDVFENLIKTNKDIDKDLGSQTLSITKSQNDDGFACLDKLVVKESEFYGSLNDDQNGTNMKNSSQNLNSQQDFTESQEIGDDIVALCTGKFYDNPFVSQVEENMQTEDKLDPSIDTMQLGNTEGTVKDVFNKSENITKDVLGEAEKNIVRIQEKKVLNSILEELDDPKFESLPQYKYFVSDSSISNKENVQNVANKEHKKKFIIDSDDDMDEIDKSEKLDKKKTKKRKLEERALQLSDDEDDCDHGVEETDAPASDFEEDSGRIVEYDSEENEVEVQPQKSKMKRVGGDFFENEAELTSEDEWVGSGDEDEAGLDRMEREEGDDEVFQEDKLRRELGQIHMRDVLDQDKREVRLLQELLFEDGDLGDGHRQRKFRWKNADDVDESGAAIDEFAETQEEEFESEEQWRKQRHERDVFLRKMKGEEEEDVHNVSINRTTIIKANLCSRTMSSLLAETNTSPSENTERIIVAEKKTNKDIPSPKKPFASFQQSYQGSLLSRGKGALARLAAIATPLAGDIDDTPKVSAPTNRRNFVFTALTPDEIEPKVSKRKADTSAASPSLIKKMKTEEKQNNLRNSLFDYLEA